MTKKEEFEKKWVEIERDVIYVEKALNNGIFSGGRYFDFYQKKEAISAEKFVKEQCGDVIDKTTVIEIENDRRTLYRLTIIFNKNEE